MKCVGFSQRTSYIDSISELRDCIDQRIVDFLLFCGFLPVPIPNNLGPFLNVWLEHLHIDAILLSGGNDIGSSPSRDLTEYNLIQLSLSSNIPLLGICRGMQMVAHFNAVGLHTVQNHVRTRHRLTGVLSHEVNSYHSFSIDSCPVEFNVIARSEDSEIEAISHKFKPLEGWMWHPEREESFSIIDVERIQYLFSLSSR